MINSLWNKLIFQRKVTMSASGSGNVLDSSTAATNTAIPPFRGYDVCCIGFLLYRTSRNTRKEKMDKKTGVEWNRLYVSDARIPSVLTDDTLHCDTGQQLAPTTSDSSLDRMNNGDIINWFDNETNMDHGPLREIPEETVF
jgi:hypothetical protein